MIEFEHNKIHYKYRGGVLINNLKESYNFNYSLPCESYFFHYKYLILNKLTFRFVFANSLNLYNRMDNFTKFYIFIELDLVKELNSFRAIYSTLED